MNRYPVWKYAILVIALLVGLLYTLPNLFGEAPAVQVSAGKSSVKVDLTTQAKVEEALKAAGIAADAITFDGNSIKARFATTDVQLKAKDAIQKSLIPDPADPSYVVALNLLSQFDRPHVSAIHEGPGGKLRRSRLHMPGAGHIVQADLAGGGAGDETDEAQGGGEEKNTGHGSGCIAGAGGVSNQLHERPVSCTQECLA